VHYNGVNIVIKVSNYNQRYLATIKMEEQEGGLKIRNEDDRKISGKYDL